MASTAAMGSYLHAITTQSHPCRSQSRTFRGVHCGMIGWGGVGARSSHVAPLARASVRPIPSYPIRSLRTIHTPIDLPSETEGEATRMHQQNSFMLSPACSLVMLLLVQQCLQKSASIQHPTRRASRPVAGPPPVGCTAAQNERRDIPAAALASCCSVASAPASSRSSRLGPAHAMPRRGGVVDRLFRRWFVR